MGNFLDAAARVLEIEAGYSNNDIDSGGETICGISRVSWPDWEGWLIVDRIKERDQVPIVTRRLKSLAEDLYKTHFWNRLRADEMVYSIGYEVFEMSVNVSVYKASIILQESLNLLNRNGKSWKELLLDGRIGGQTLKNMKCLLQERTGEKNLVVLLNVLQAEYYLQLARMSPAQEVFLRGWLGRT